MCWEVLTSWPTGWAARWRPSRGGDRSILEIPVYVSYALTQNTDNGLGDVTITPILFPVHTGNPVYGTTVTIAPYLSFNTGSYNYGKADTFWMTGNKPEPNA